MRDFLESSIEISQDVLSQEINGETVLLDLKSQSYFGLGRTATRIWQLLQDGRDLKDLHKTMSEEFDVGPEELGNDLLEHLQELADAGLISIVGPDVG